MAEPASNTDEPPVPKREDGEKFESRLESGRVNATAGEWPDTRALAYDGSITTDPGYFN